MDSYYKIEDTSQIISPGLVVFRELVEVNIERMIVIAGDQKRLRPHCKTHKMIAVTRMQLERGISKHKCATLAEAEMLAEAGVKDIFLAYNIVGPNIDRVVRFLNRYPDVGFSVTADHPKPIRELSQAVSSAGCSVDVVLDLDTGMHRTGTLTGALAKELYCQIEGSPGLKAGGLHVYDGHNKQTDLDERRIAVNACWMAAVDFRDELVSNNLKVPRIVAGGTGSFPLYAEKDEATLELSPGTSVFFDAGYSDLFPDLNFTPAALILTRVISRPAKNLVTCDLGSKSCASDPPFGKRVVFPDLLDALQVLQNEEHLVLETDRAEEFEPGDELLAIPQHVCPTSALYREAYVISSGKLVDRWEVSARDRWLTI
jgi:D-serine deaminase-like pyridoxal phosphate-dependent protein